MSRYIKIDGCETCEYSDYLEDGSDTFMCKRTAKRCPPYGIPNWCPLPVLPERDAEAAVLIRSLVAEFRRTGHVPPDAIEAMMRWVDQNTPARFKEEERWQITAVSNGRTQVGAPFAPAPRKTW